MTVYTLEEAIDLVDPYVRVLVITAICQTFVYGEPSGCLISPSCIPSIDLVMNPGPSRHIFLSLSHLDLHHGVRYLPSNPFMLAAFFSINFMME